MTHYEVLGIAPTADAAQIREAYLRAARSAHPDLEPDPRRRSAAEARMQRVNAAWAVLGDAQQRRRYDDELLAERRLRRGPAGAPSPGFVPFDAGDDEPDPALLDDRGVEGTEVPRALQLLPVVLLAAAVFALSAGLVSAFAPIVAIGALCLVGAVVAFLAAPALAVSRSIRHERR